MTTAMLSAIALLAALCLAPGGVVHAAAQANQEWFGAEANGYGYYLGLSSGGNGYRGHIHTFNASDKCLEVVGQDFYSAGFNGVGVSSNSQNANGDQVHIWDCEPADAAHGYDLNQLWTQEDEHNGSWLFYLVGWGNDKVNGVSSIYCLDAPGGQVNSPVVVTRCNGGITYSELWTIGPQGQLQNVGGPGLCMDDSGWNPNNGAKMILWWCQYD
jgi:hypothetical protein